MRCRVGDLAVVVRSTRVPEHLGRIVEVLALAPVGVKFLLPDGVAHSPLDSGCWIIKAVGSPFNAPMAGGTFRSARYAAGADSALRPIRPDADPVTTDDTLTVNA